MGREEEREILSGSRPAKVPDVDLERATGGQDEPPTPPPPDRPGASPDERPSASAFESGDPDAVPADVTDSAEYQEELAAARRRAKAGEAVLDDGREQMPPTRYEDG